MREFPVTALNGKKIVIVGGSSGIGLGVAAAALGQDASVVIVGRSPERLRGAERTLGPDPRVTIQSVDVTNEPAVAGLFEEVGAFDHLVSTAGTAPPSDPIGFTDVDFARRFVDNKLMGAIILVKHAVRTLKTGGSITFTSGINKDRPPVPGGAIVSGIAGSFSYFARALALELAPTRVNVVSPGWVDTPMWDLLVGEAKAGFFAEMATRLPSRRVATPADAASAYLYLMQNDFVTGETLRNDGGQSLI
jgi:NAD(P)-dependent dehydrogenase (short-subunit alcohol dehydrogenase family)